MKTLILFLFAVISFEALASKAPFHSFEEQKFVAVDSTTKSLSLTTETLSSTKVSYSRGSKAFTTTAGASSQFAIGTELPEGALITGSYLIVKGVLVSANGNTLDVDCGSIDLIDSPTNLTGADVGTMSISSLLPFIVPSPCTPTLKVGAGVSGITAGEVQYLVIYIE